MRKVPYYTSKKVGWSTVISLLLVLLYSYADIEVRSPDSTDSNHKVEQALESTGVVTRVVDGDTIVTRIEGKDYTIRMIGINTPETVDPRKKVECFGKEASQETKKLLPVNTLVVLKADTTQDRVDTYGRLLRYVYREPDNLFINEYLVRQGYAHEYTYNKNPHLQSTEFQKAEEAARTEGKGLWAANACESM